MPPGSVLENGWMYLCVTIVLASYPMYQYLHATLSTKKKESLYASGHVGLIGNTPLVKLQSLSEATGCEILVIEKC